MKRTVSTLSAAVLLVGVFAAFAPAASADPVQSATAEAFGATIAVTDQDAIPPTPEATITLPPGGDVHEVVIDVPADPLAVSGTLIADAKAHAPSDIASALTVEAQTVTGPYNASGVGQVEGLDVLLNQPSAGVSLLSAAVVRAEAVAVCTAGQVKYGANSEIIDLKIGGTDIPLNAPVSDLIDAISGVLTDSGLNQVVDVQRNVVTVDANGASVDALVVTVLAAAGDVPLATVRIAHAEVNSVACQAAATTAPQCSDTVDNIDGEDTLADAADPGCHTDGDATNAATYDPADDDETDNDVLPRTGGEAGTAVLAAAGLAVMALGALTLRRRLI